MLMLLRRCCAAGLLALLSLAARAELPPGFGDVLVLGGWNQAVGMTFAPDGRLFVWEKAGRVWIVQNGVRRPSPLIDISEEVGDWVDYGLIGFAIDPGFYANGYIYLLYVVDYHHLLYFGTDQYNPNANYYGHDTIGRLTRYTANAADGFYSVDPDSRLILVGEAMTTGFPICHRSHGVGSVLFGEDGSLLVSCGDGASFGSVDVGGWQSGSSNTALTDGIITPSEDVGSYRSQLVNSLSGKILRLDPATGDGLPDNPYFDPAEPRAPRSRVWALGLRNPYRMTVRPWSGYESGRHDGPGSLYLGDVGWYTWEDLHVCRAAGENFGWPAFEGLEIMPNYYDADVENLDAPNPLFGQGGCTQAYFYFRDLIRQDVANDQPEFPNPCDSGVQIPDEIAHFEHTRPVVEWGHGAGPSRTGVFVGNDAAVIRLDDPDSPVTGPNFGGSTSTGGAWYTGDAFPSEYHDTYFHGDYGAGWIRNFVFDEEDRPLEVRDFASAGTAAVVCLAVSPVDGGLYYLGYDDVGASELRRIGYYPDNLPPVAAAQVSPYYGPGPLTVQFDTVGSSDPEGFGLTYEWSFGDFTPPSRIPNPVHVYPSEDITQQGSIIARVFELDPPGSQGSGNHDPEVLRDGDYPPTGSPSSTRQFDTFHNGEQGNTDWIGYEFSQVHTFRALVLQEGLHLSNGGWFDAMRVQVRQSGVWWDAGGMVSRPVYPGNNGVSYEMFELSFAPLAGDAIRLVANPGGSANFISAGELRVIAVPLNSPPGPKRFDPRVTVRDLFGAQATATALVSLNNTPPAVTILSPVDGALYSMDEDTPLDLLAEISDAEHPPDKLTCAWQAILHHNSHTHPGPVDPECQTTSVISPAGCDGEEYSYELRLVVTDSHGLATTRSAFLYPDCDGASCPADINRDGAIDLLDLSLLLADFGDTGPPHTIPGDLDYDGDVDLDDLSSLLIAFENGCE